MWLKCYREIQTPHTQVEKKRAARILKKSQSCCPERIYPEALFAYNPVGVH